MKESERLIAVEIEMSNATAERLMEKAEKHGVSTGAIVNAFLSSPATHHFNKLTEAEQERLVCVAEEAAEVVHAIMKTLRHGYESTDPTKTTGETNRQMVERELGNLGNAVRKMEDAGDINHMRIVQQAALKGRSEQYLHHQ